MGDSEAQMARCDFESGQHEADCASAIAEEENPFAPKSAALNEESHMSFDGQFQVADDGHMTESK